ncbi:alpha/beta fold hydrolase [Bacillus sp. S/N-304-OC-R1]|uniref:alpha/beta fold hydrolase n=1 Tax=Bacillus sp. S/N-304-OC-R1 TaxID=2758034 RepID=UPI001C8D6935|nr:alpha/beta hydrolase [Bacillus sp. S/N-304-OC-R1]MBY0124297.1 alpha/beta hydrolase [Bacillus sp. S/N-304-OC-R1]
MENTLIQRIIHLNGNDIYYENYQQHSSSKETIVLLHGFLSSSFSFRRLIPFLTKEYNVISIDLPPFGKSGKSRQYKYSFKNLAMTVVKLVESLGLQKITLLGHSMGGQIALYIAHIRPDLVEGVILLCSSGYLKKSKPSLILASYLPFFHLFVKRWLERSGLENNLKLVVHNQSMIDKEMEEGYLAPFLEDDIFLALTKLIRDREGDLTSEILKDIQVPCLLIWGDEDRVVPLHTGKKLHEDLNRSQLIVLRETGHLIPEERPEEVFHYIKEFIQKG